MLRKVIPTLAAAALLAVPASAQDTQQRGQLRWQLEEGDVLRYDFTWNLEQMREFKGLPQAPPPMGMTVEVAYTLRQEVQAVSAEGVATIEATVEKIAMDLSLGMMGDLSYDSLEDAANSPLRGARHFVDQSFRFDLGADGAVLGVSGGDAIRDEVVAALEEEMAGNQGQGGGMGMMPSPQQIGAGLIGVFADSFGDGPLQDSLSNVNAILPADGEAAEGATWSREVEARVPSFGSLRYDAEFQHRGSAQGNVRITSRNAGDVELEQDLPEEGAAGPQAELARAMAKNQEVTGSDASGTATFSTTSGRLLDSEVTREVDSEGPLPPEILGMMGGQANDEMKLAQTFSLTLRYVLQEEGAGEEAPETGAEGSF